MDGRADLEMPRVILRPGEAGNLPAGQLGREALQADVRESDGGGGGPEPDAPAGDKEAGADGFGPRLNNALPWDRAANGLGLSWLPFTSQPLAFGPLRRRDLALKERNGLLGHFIALRPGQQIPFVSFRLVLRHTSAIGINDAE